MNKSKYLQGLSPKVESSLQWLGAANLIYSLYLLESFAYLLMQGATQTNSDGGSLMRSYVPLLVFLNIILLLAARTVKTADLSMASWIALPVALQMTLFGFVYIAIEVKAHWVALLSVVAILGMPQMHFFALRRQILSDRRPMRASNPLAR